MAKIKKKISNEIKSKYCLNKTLTADLSQTVEFLKIISEKNRLKILCLLQEGEKCVCEIWRHLELAQNLVSHHLKVLKDFNLILSRKEGVKNFYRLNQKVVKRYSKLLNKFLNSKDN